MSVINYTSRDQYTDDYRVKVKCWIANITLGWPRLNTYFKCQKAQNMNAEWLSDVFIQDSAAHGDGSNTNIDAEVHSRNQGPDT